MGIIEILKERQEFLKISAIEESIGLPKTTLVRAIARGVIPGKFKDEIEKWWEGFAKIFACELTDITEIAGFAKKLADLEAENKRLNDNLQKSLQAKKVSLADFLQSASENIPKKDNRTPYQLARSKRKNGE